MDTSSVSNDMDVSVAPPEEADIDDSESPTHGTIEADEADAFIIDTTDLSEVVTYVRKVHALEVNCGNDFLKCIETLPRTNAKTGRSNTTVRVLKALKALKVLPDTFKKAASKFNREDKKRFEEGLFIAVGNAAQLKTLQFAVLTPFTEMIRDHDRPPVSFQLSMHRLCNFEHTVTISMLTGRENSKFLHSIPNLRTNIPNARSIVIL